MYVYIKEVCLTRYFTSIWFTSSKNTELTASQVLPSTIGTALTLKISGSAPLLGFPRQGFLLCFIWALEASWQYWDQIYYFCIFKQHILPSSILCDYCSRQHFLILKTNKTELCWYTGLTSNIKVLHDVTPCWLVTFTSWHSIKSSETWIFITAIRMITDFRYKR